MRVQKVKNLFAYVIFFFVFGFAFPMLSPAVYAQTVNTEPWQQIGVGGAGTFQTIGFSPVLNGNGTYTIYLGGDTLGLFRSENNGNSWIPSGNGLYDFETSKVIVNPGNPNIVYLTTNGGFYKSTDGGASWSPKNYGRTYSTYGARNNMLASMAIDPKNPNVVFIGTGYLRNNSLPPDNATQIYKSTDGGETWGNGPVYASSGLIVYSLAVNPNNSNSVYAALGFRGSGKLLHSTDGGVTWGSLDSTATHAYYGLVFDKNDNLYISGWDGSLATTGQCGPGGATNANAMRVVRRNDTTGQMTDITPSRTAALHLNTTCKIDISPANELYVSDNASWGNAPVWKCPTAATCQTSSWIPLATIGRDGWRRLTKLNTPIWALGVSPDNSAWAGTSMMLYKLNANSTWDEQYSQAVTGGYLTRGNENTVITSRDMIFINTDEYYFGPADVYIEGTKDKGKSFNIVSYPDSGGSMNDSRVLVADKDNANIWFVVTHLQDQKSNHGKLLKKDAAGVWSVIFTSCTGGSACPFSPVTVANGGGILDVYAKGSIILVSTYNDGIYRSTDSGSNWVKVSSLGTTDVYKFAGSGTVPGLYFAATNAGIWKSADNGASWTKLTSFPGTYAEAVVWAGANTWYTSGSAKIYKTSDNGSTWSLVYTWVRKSDIYTATLPSGEDIAAGIKNPNDPNANPVCAGFNMIANYDHVSNGGLACSVNGGASGTWEQVNIGGILGRGHGVEFNPYDPDELFYLSYGAGAYKTRLATSQSSSLIISTGMPTPAGKAGDANGDGIVDETDYSVWLSHFGQTIAGGATVGDFNGDGTINGIDYAIWLNNYGK